MASCNSWQYLVTILAKIFPRSWQDLAKILLRYPWRVDSGEHGVATHVTMRCPITVVTQAESSDVMSSSLSSCRYTIQDLRFIKASLPLKKVDDRKLLTKVLVLNPRLNVLSVDSCAISPSTFLLSCNIDAIIH